MILLVDIGVLASTSLIGPLSDEFDSHKNLGSQTDDVQIKFE